jgi:hypothetical protein
LSRQWLWRWWWLGRWERQPSGVYVQRSSLTALLIREPGALSICGGSLFIEQKPTAVARLNGALFIWVSGANEAGAFDLWTRARARWTCIRAWELYDLVLRQRFGAFDHVWIYQARTGILVSSLVHFVYNILIAGINLWNRKWFISCLGTTVDHAYTRIHTVYMCNKLPLAS